MLDYRYKLALGAVVRGSIKFFNADKGFGFVSVFLDDAGNFVDVFIRKEKGRLVTGTHNEPGFTDEFCDYSDFRFHRGDTAIIMRVEPDGRGGWRARSWGVLPEYTWIDLYLDWPDKYVAKYVGGRVELSNSSPYATGGYTARIDGLELTRKHLVVRARHYPIGWRLGDREPAEAELGRAFKRSYPLVAAVKDDRFGWLQLEIREGETYSRLTFWPPKGQ